MKKNKKVFYYNDESNDDFFPTKTSLSVTVDGNYNYLPKSALFKVFSFVFNFVFALPLLFIANTLVFGVSVKGRKNIKELKQKGFFVYANHTSFQDAWLTPIFVAPFRKNYIIVNKNAIQIPVVASLVKAGGALPVPDTIGAFKNLNQAINEIVVNKKQIVTIFPEAHIWPYYTKVRPFPQTSFKFAAKANAPVVPVAVCYERRAILGNKRKPKTTVYIGRPVYPKPELSEKENAAFLRDETHKFIKETTAIKSTFAYIDYVKQIDDQQIAVAE
ncbi:MAG: lysophospholipid acyltransferase family protein [Christensenellales bacterium]|jgi:1-acyl-sn-glycerol-3-phosphate acyltransferase